MNIFFFLEWEFQNLMTSRPTPFGKYQSIGGHLAKGIRCYACTVIKIILLPIIVQKWLIHYLYSSTLVLELMTYFDIRSRLP